MNREIRFKETLKFLKKYVGRSEEILDLGVDNELANYLRCHFSNIKNTKGENLDFNYKKYLNSKVTVAFEIFEHMLAPYNILKELKGELVCSVPLKVWFASAYWNKKEKWGMHYHEFEIKQFNYLLESTGWKIIDVKIMRKPDKLRMGIRPLLRFIWNSYYFVYAIKD